MTACTRHVLCAVDYSAASRSALRWAALAAKQARARLTVLTVTDPLLVEAMNDCSDDDWTVAERGELRAFCRESLGTEQPFDAEIRAGRAADEIHAAAARMRADLLVLGSHGLTGIHKTFFGSTAERVLRETDIPVLVTPGDVQAQHGLATLASAVRHILVPIDLTGASAALVRLGAALGKAIDVPVLVAHAIEPLHVPARWHSRVPSLHLEARDRAEAAMHRVVEEAGGEAESIVLFGDAADAIINVANVRAAGLILMGLQQSGLGRVGVIAHRVLCRSHVPVLALPSAAAVGLASQIAVPVPAVACADLVVVRRPSELGAGLCAFGNSQAMS